MADPVVHITNGIPDLGTGNITTLGMTLTDGANATIGSTADSAIAAGAAGTINAHLRSLSRDLVSGIVIQAGANTIGNVGQSGSPWGVNVSQFGGSAVVTGIGISGAGIPRVTVSSDSTIAVSQSGTWNIASVTGSLPLPTGAATAAKQPAIGTAGVPAGDVLTIQGVSSMTPLKVDGAGGSFPVSGTVGATQSGVWNITNISGAISLPTGAATAAKQPAPSTAGSPSADVISIQGVSGMVPVKIGLFGNAGAILDFAGQNASGTVGAQLVGGQYNFSPTTLVSGNFSPLQLDSAANLLVSARPQASGTATQTSVAASTSSVNLLSSNAARLQALIYNDSSANLFVLLGSGVASATAFSVKLVPGAYYELPFGPRFTGAIQGIWDATGGAARVTELT